jgi:hypothetical protein
MSSTTTTCPLCGLRFPGRPLLGQASIAHDEVIAMTIKQRSRSGQATTALRRAIAILRSPARADRDA